MLLYVGKNFTASVSGSIVKEVNCERCRGRFYYQLARAASHTTSAPYSEHIKPNRRTLMKTAETITTAIEAPPTKTSGSQSTTKTTAQSATQIPSKANTRKRR